MDLNSQCLNLGGCVGGSSASAAKIVKKQKTPVVLDSGRPFVPSAEFASFPASVSHLVGDYVSDSDREDVETAFAGVQRITLCLSQDIGSKLASCWSIGFLPPTHLWEPSDIMIDKEYLIQDYEGCLQFLEQQDSNYCRVVIEVLVVKLNKTSKDLPMALDDLRKTTVELQRYLGSVKHVVFSIKEYVSCYFTFKDVFDRETGKSQPVDHVNALFKIIKDLKTCWKIKKRLTVFQMFNFYFKSGRKRASEMYLAKFVIPFNIDHNRNLYAKEHYKMLSTKIMWICSLKSLGDFLHIDQFATRLCHAFYLDLSKLKYDDVQRLHMHEQAPLCFQYNRFIERIVIHSGNYCCTMQLPRPSVPLTDDMPRSALIELTLKCDFQAFYLTQLNNGYFPHLAHLCIIGGQIGGHLDSQRVPSLKTLIIELGLSWNHANSKVHSLVRERTQSLIRADRLWQLVASQDQEGWSLASYDKSIENPQDDGKEDVSQSPPFIRELMLVMKSFQHAEEFQSWLNGDPSLDAEADDQKDSFFEWAPERVEKFTAFNLSMFLFQLKFQNEIPEKSYILTSLAFHGIVVELRGAALPLLQSLEVNRGEVTLSGTFPHLQKLSFKETYLLSPWEVNAPLLESLDCQKVKKGGYLSLRLKQLPHLSYLRIDPWEGNPAESPTIFFDNSGQGLSRVKHVVFGGGMTESPCFEMGQVYNVSQLELNMDALEFVTGWFDTQWLCETLTINVYANNPEALRNLRATDIRVHLLLPKVKTLIVTEKDCHVLLNSEMPELTELTVPSPKSLGSNLKCPKLEYIHFTDD